MCRVVVLVAVLFAHEAHAATVSGTVFLDHDGDGLFGAGDEPVGAATVAWERAPFTTTAGDGTYSLTVPTGARGLVWVSVPESGRPGPVWAAVDAIADVTADLAITPAAPPAGTTRFVVAADSHIASGNSLWTPDDLALALDAALALPEPPAFVTIVGDITQANRPDEFTAVSDVMREMSVPWVPVPGNHDWYDGGAAYRASWGPDCYSFSIRDAHVIVWNSNLSPARIRDFIEADLARVDPARTIIALGHAPPSDEVATAMYEAGVSYLFSGHWHANRVVDRGGLIEIGTQTLLMGGIDLVPAGYRVVSVGRGSLEIDHHTFVADPFISIAWPAADVCAPRALDVAVSVELGSGLREVTAIIDGQEHALSRAGGWVWQAVGIRLAPGVHSLTAIAKDDLGAITQVARAFTVCRDAVARTRPRTGEWRQVQGNPEHRGAAAASLATPLRSAWIAAIGGHSHQAPPVSDGDLVYVTATDLAGGGTGGVVAFELLTGRQRWRATTSTPVRSAPAVDAGLVVFSENGGVVRAVDAIDGTPRWAVDLGEDIDATQSALWAAPAIRDGIAYVGIQRRLAAIDVASGTTLWTVDPSPLGSWLGSFSSVAVTADAVIGTFERGSGVVAYDRTSGDELWRVPFAEALAVNASIVVADELAFVGDARGVVIAIDVASGVVLWRTAVVEGGDDWAYSIAGTPAYAHGKLFVPTQRDRLVALDASTGIELWHHMARAGAVRSAHYRGVQAGYQGGPVVAGRTVWFADTSGTLIGADIDTGAPRWSVHLGAPALSGMAIAGEVLLVPTFDGVLRAFVPAPAREAELVDPAPPIEASGCCGTSRGAIGSVMLAFVVGLILRGRRRARGFPLAVP